MSRRLLEHGIEARPAPILADLLGMHITTAARWVDYARRDWSAYLAARAEDLQTRARTRMGPTPGE
jgi:hypothetical protein